MSRLSKWRLVIDKWRKTGVLKCLSLAFLFDLSPLFPASLKSWQDTPSAIRVQARRPHYDRLLSDSVFMHKLCVLSALVGVAQAICPLAKQTSIKRTVRIILTRSNRTDSTVHWTLTLRVYQCDSRWEWWKGWNIMKNEQMRFQQTQSSDVLKCCISSTPQAIIRFV